MINVSLYLARKLVKRITRIKYNKVGDNLISQPITNRFGLVYIIEIHKKGAYILQKLRLGCEVLEAIEYTKLPKVKRILRDLLINKYSVIMINEVRQNAK
jgi:hypothetical protein